MPELEPFELIRAAINPESVKKGTPLYEIESEFQQWVILHADFFLERYEKAHPEKHWKEDERKNIRLGLCGQKAFELLLQLMEIPYVPNDPIIDQRIHKPYDFNIPKAGRVEVKTIAAHCQKVLVKLSEWHGNDYCVAWQMNKDETTLTMIGWLTKQQVEAYTVTPQGETKFNPYSDSYIIDISELNPTENFIQILKEAKPKIYA